MSEGKTEIYLEGLPKWENNRCKGGVNWKNSKGFKVKCIYYGEYFEFKIIDYERIKKRYLTIKYNEEYFEIKTEDFIMCRFGKVLGRIKSDFKIEIGQTFKDDKRDITIIDRKYEIKKGIKYKLYKYKCNNPECGFECGEHYKSGEYKKEHWIQESSLLNGVGCSCCGGNKIVVENINSIYKTDTWMIEYFLDIEESKKYSKSSGKKIKALCPNCERIKYIKISNLYRHGLGCFCGDGKSYPEKFMMELLVQLGVKFQTEYTPKWIGLGKRRYDFYFVLDNTKYIIETHGLQHYKDQVRGRTLEEEQENDRLKKQLALDNGIWEENYIVIDCRKSELEFIKNNILHSRLNELFDLSKIDWLKCEEFALSNLVKEACQYKENNPDMTTGDIGKTMGLNSNTISKYLKQGVAVGWCNYDPKEEFKKLGEKNGMLLQKLLSKPIKMLDKDMNIIYMFSGATECERQSEKLFGTKLHKLYISKVCNKKAKTYKKYIFDFVTQDEYQEWIKYDKENKLNELVQAS